MDFNKDVTDIIDNLNPDQIADLYSQIIEGEVLIAGNGCCTQFVSSSDAIRIRSASCNEDKCYCILYNTGEYNASYGTTSGYQMDYAATCYK
ncbi:hypothetical protein IJ182_08340 [bacterium]|nr:hypothetical protein [bacterium]